MSGALPSSAILSFTAHRAVAKRTVHATKDHGVRTAPARRLLQSPAGSGAERPPRAPIFPFNSGPLRTYTYILEVMLRLCSMGRARILQRA